MADSGMSDYQFLITKFAQDDMHLCKDEDSYAAAKIATFLRECHADPRVLELNIDTSASDNVIKDVKEVISLQRQRINAYRTKLVEVAAWRLLFIVDRKTARIGLFAVMHRDQDYESDVELWSDIEREFDDYGFTRY